MSFRRTASLRVLLPVAKVIGLSITGSGLRIGLELRARPQLTERRLSVHLVGALLHDETVRLLLRGCWCEHHCGRRDNLVDAVRNRVAVAVTRVGTRVDGCRCGDWLKQ